MGRKSFHKIINILLLAIFLCYFGSVTLFYHCHTIDGVTIVHSHFYIDGDSSQDDSSTIPVNHTHSSSQLHLISHLSNIVSLLATFTFLFRFFLLKTYKTLVYKDILVIYNTHLTSLSLRAPPIAIL